jgi:hypothetical protein
MIRDRLLGWFWARVEPTKRDVGDGAGNVFFWRYRLIRGRFFGVFLHEFLRSDAERCLHDHPWGFISIVLRAGYWEELPGGVVKWRRPGSILVRRATDSHRITINHGSKPWSLVIVGPKVREWGFHTLVGWKAWKAGEASPIFETDDPRLMQAETFGSLDDEGSGDFPRAPRGRLFGTGYVEVRPEDMRT